MKEERGKRPVLIDNRYKTLKKLGTGSMGDVYKVRDLKDKRIIALKMLSKEKTSSDTVRRFKREFRLLAELHHPNLCSVYDFGILKDGRSYFTMEYINGPDIFEFTKKLPYEKIYPVRKNISNGVYPLIVQLCRALEYIHSKGLIHYDIKPGNVLIAEGKEQGAKTNRKHYAQSPMPCVKLMDFGLAGEERIKGGTLIRGTFPYIAPEIIKGLAIDHRVDLYSLAVLLYGIFTKRSLHVKGKKSYVTLLEQQREMVFEPPSKIVKSMPDRLEQLIVRLLSFEPAARFSRANEVIKEINRFTHLRFPLETEKTIEGYLLSSRFVGREKEMGLLKSLYEGSQRGEGKVVVVTGDAGIGKSRLLKEFKIYTQMERSSTFMGYAHKDKIVPLEIFHNIFSELMKYMGDGRNRFQFKGLKLSLAVLFRIFPDLTNGHLKKNLPKLVPLEPKQEKLRTFDALSELIKHITSDIGEMVILLEDLHWADDLSIQFLEYLGRNLEDRNILVCGTSRKAELEENPALKKMMINLRKENYLSQFELKPLKFRSLYSFLDSTITSGSNSSELVRYLMKKTGGNLFFVEEMMRTLLQKRGVSIGERVDIRNFKRIAIPETIEDVVLKRTKDLDSKSKKVVKFASILLKDFSYDFMNRLTGLDDTVLTRVLWELRKRQVLIEKGDRYRFYHETLREAVDKRMAYREKRKLYYQIGRTLELIYKRNIGGVVEDLAYYFINARDTKKGIQYGLRAARKSSGRYANEQAIRFYKGVLGLLGNKNLRLRFDILQDLAKIEVLIGYYDDAIKHFKKALSLETGTINKRIEGCVGIGDVYVRRGEYNKALRVYRRGIRLVEKLKSSKSKVLLETNINVKICSTHLQIGDYKRAEKLNFNALRSLKDLRGKESIRLLGSIYFNMGTNENVKGNYGKGEFDRAIYFCKEAYKCYKKIKAKDKIATVLISLGMSYAFKLDLQKAFDYYQKSIQISEKIGNYYSKLIALYNLGRLFKDKGCYLKALDCYRGALSIAKKSGNPLMTGSSLLGLGDSFLKLCDYREAKKCYERALKIFDEGGWKGHKVYAIWDIGSIHKEMGNFTLALRFYKNALRIFTDMKYQKAFADLFIDVGSLFIQVGEFSRARRYIKDALKIATTFRLKDIMLDYAIALCRIDILTGDYAIANEYYEKRIKVAKELGLKRQLLQFSLVIAEVYYHEEKYLRGNKTADKAIKMAKEMGTKDLYAEALLSKVKNGIKVHVLSKIEIIGILDEAKRIAEEVRNPEVLWKVYFEYGRFLQDDEQYYRASRFYKKCIEVYKDVISRIKNESFKKSYLNRPDRREVFTAVGGI